MRQIIRFYVRHDLDLIGLRIQGISMAKLAKIALESYANGKRVHICLDAGKIINRDDVSNILNEGSRKYSLTTFKCEFTTNDLEAVKLLKSIKKTYRNQFCKTLIRNTLTEQSLIPFFTEINDVNKENAYLSGINKDYIPNLIPTPIKGNKIDAEKYLREHSRHKTEEKIEENKEYSPTEIKPENATEIKEETINKEEYIETSSEPQTLPPETPPISAIEEVTVEAPENTISESSNEIRDMFDSLIEEL